MVFEFDSTHGFLNSVLQQKLAQNQKFSLRAMAKHIGVSPSALSAILAASKTPSTATILKISRWLKLGKKEHEYLETLARLEQSEADEIRQVLTRKLAELKPSFSSDVVSRVRNLMATTTIAASYMYCIPGTSQARNLVRLKDRSTNRLIKSFYECLLLPEQFVSDTIFFIENPDGSFNSYQNQNLNGQINFPEFVERNRNLKVTFDSQGFPTVHNLTMRVVAKNLFLLANLVFSKASAKIEVKHPRIPVSPKAIHEIPEEIIYRAIS